MELPNPFFNCEPGSNENPLYEMFKKKPSTSKLVTATSQTVTDYPSLTEELTSSPAKTPVSILQEILSRKGSTPKYELVQIEGAIHEPTFRYRVTVGDTVALGTGRSKKVAKHEAAKNILEKLGRKIDDTKSLDAETTSQQNTTVFPVQSVSSSEKLCGNPIGALQEMCISRRWPPPVYEMTNEEGLPHERQFTIACVVSKYREIGAGKSKKLAKRQAAYKMWEKLQECPIEFLKVDQREEPVKFSRSTCSEYSGTIKSQISVLMGWKSLNVSTFHTNLKQNKGFNVEQLQLPFNRDQFDAFRLLENIATEQKFEVTYVDIEEVSLTGQRQCLVQLSAVPVAVCHGTGGTEEEARYAAAVNALEYLKIMTKN